MGIFRRSKAEQSGSDNAPSSTRNHNGAPPPQFWSSMPNSCTACVDMHAEVSADAHALFSLLSDPFQHEKIFNAIEGSTARLLEVDGPRKKYELDYAARWKFWKVSGVCQNLLHMETDSDRGTVSFRLREPGFLRIYEGTWSILPLGADVLNTSSLKQATEALICSTSSRPSSPKGSMSSSIHSSHSSTVHASQEAVLEANLLAAMTNPLMNSPLMGTTKVPDTTTSNSSSLSKQSVLGQRVKRAEQARAVVRVSKMMMSPKIAPPYPLNHILKGQAVAQVQDMLDGLLAATSAKLTDTEESVESMLLPKTLGTSSMASCKLAPLEEAGLSMCSNSEAE